jgi:hypothetical protein
MRSARGGHADSRADLEEFSVNGSSPANTNQHGFQVGLKRQDLNYSPGRLILVHLAIE